MSFNSDFSTLSFLQTSSLLILSDHLIFATFLKIHISNEFILFSMSLVKVQVSQPYVNTEYMKHLMSLNLRSWETSVLVDLYYDVLKLSSFCVIITTRCGRILVVECSQCYQKFIQK